MDWQNQRLEQWCGGVRLRDLQELKQLFKAGKPPASVKAVVWAAMALLRPEITGSPSVVQAYAFLKDPVALLTALSRFDIDKAAEPAVKRFHRYIDKDALDVREMRGVSGPATALCMWCHALAARRAAGGINAGVPTVHAANMDYNPTKWPSS